MVISLLVLGLTILAPVAAAGEVLVSINNAPDEVTMVIWMDADFTVTVDISEVVDLNAVQYDISFDPSVLQLYDITAGQIDSTVIGVMFNEIISPGTYRVVQSMELEKVSGSGSLAVLHFHVIGSPGDSITINLSNGLLSGMEGEIPATWIGGSGESVSTISAEAGEGELPPTAPPSPEPETPGAPTTEGDISEPAWLWGGSGKPASTISEEEEEVVAEEPASPTPPSPTPPLPEAAAAKPVNWPVIWGAIGGVLVLGLVIFLLLQVRRRSYY